MLKLKHLFYLLLLLAVHQPSVAQQPHSLHYFFNRDTVGNCVRAITLSDDSVYFYSGVCETDVAIAKGKWVIDSDRLVLSNFDRTDSWPACKVSSKPFYAPDSVHFTVTDYFGKPFAGMRLLVSDSAGNAGYAYTDSAGCITLGKAQCVGYCFKYLLDEAEARNKEENGFTVTAGQNDITINIAFPAMADLGYGARVIDFEHLEFTIKEGVLTDDTGKPIYNNHYFTTPGRPLQPTPKRAGGNK